MGLFSSSSKSTQHSETEVNDFKTTGGAAGSVVAGPYSQVTITDGGIVTDALGSIERNNVRTNQLMSRIVETEAKLASGELENLGQTFLGSTAPLALLVGSIWLAGKVLKK